MTTARLASPTDVHAKVFAFLAGEFARKGEYQCKQIELMRGRGNGFNDSIRSWQRAEQPEAFEIRITRLDAQGKPVDHENPGVREFANEIVRICEGEVQGTGGKHRFTLKSTQACDRRQQVSFVIAISASAEDGDESEGDIEPTNSGKDMLLMRGFSDMLRINKDMHASTLGVVGGIAREQTVELRELRLENAELTKKVRELENDKTAQEWKIYQEQIADNRAKQSIDRLFQIGTVVVGNLTRGALPAGGATGEGSPVVMLLREFFASITPDQQPKLMQALTMPQLMMLQSISQYVAPPEPPPSGPAPNPSPNGSTNGVH